MLLCWTSIQMYLFNSSVSHISCLIWRMCLPVFPIKCRCQAEVPRVLWGVPELSQAVALLILLLLVLLPPLAKPSVVPWGHSPAAPALSCTLWCPLELPELRNGHVFPSALTGGLWRKGWEHDLRILRKNNCTCRYIYVHMYACA